MAEQKKDEKSGKQSDDKSHPEKKQPERGKGQGQKKDEPKGAESGAPKPAQSHGAYKLVAMKPVEGPQGWIVKVDVYYSAPGKEFLGVFADIEVLDGKVRSEPVDKFGANLDLPYQRHDRTVQFSVVRLWQKDDDVNDKTKAINPDVHTDPVFLPGKPFAHLKPRAPTRPNEGFFKNLWAVFLGKWE